MSRVNILLPASQGVVMPDAAFVEPIKAMIEEEMSFEYRKVAKLRVFNNNTGQRIL